MDEQPSGTFTRPPGEGSPEVDPQGPAVTASGERKREIRRIAVASCLGSVLEWYDFFLYGFVAVLVFGPLFFPSYSSLAGTMASLGTFLVGFIARPIGGLVFGHFGDRIGRKRMLLLTILIMGVSSTLTGLLPTYATIGVAAPILLVVFRFVQGIGLGGEWGGAALMTIEYAPQGKRGFFGSFVQAGAPLGQGLGLVVLLVGALAARQDTFVTWGWRVPFVASAVIMVVGIYIRLKIAETPAFQKAQASHSVRRFPVVDVFREHRRPVLLAFLLYVGGTTIPWFATTVFLVGYLQNNLHVDRTATIVAFMASQAFWVIACLTGGALTDRIGRRPVFMIGASLMVVLAFPIFWVATLGSPLWIFVSLALFGIPLNMCWGSQATFAAELFPTNVRYTGMSVSGQGATLLGGAVPLVATSLVVVAGGTWPVSLIIVAVCSLTVIAAIAAPETRRLTGLPD